MSPSSKSDLKRHWKVSYLVSAYILLCQLQTPPHIATKVNVTVSLLHLNYVNVFTSYSTKNTISTRALRLIRPGTFPPEPQPLWLCQLRVCARLSPPNGLYPCCSLCLECFSSPSLSTQLLLTLQSPAQALLPLTLTYVSGFSSLLIPKAFLRSICDNLVYGLFDE